MRRKGWEVTMLMKEIWTTAKVFYFKEGYVCQSNLMQNVTVALWNKLLSCWYQLVLPVQSASHCQDKVAKPVLVLLERSYLERIIVPGT